MKVFFYELGKIFGNVKILAFLLAAMLINIAFLIYNEYNEYFSPESYNAIWGDLQSMSENEMSEFLQERSAAFETLHYDQETELSADYTGELYREQALINYVKKEVEECLTYGRYLQSINESAQTLIAIPFFAEENSFDYKNIIKTQEDFRHLEGKSLEPQPSKGILTAVQFGFTDIITLVLLMFFNVILISREKELGQINLFQATENGGTILAVSKLGAVFASDIISVVLIYGGSFGTGFFLYGFGELSRDIQSIYGFFGSNLDITAGEFLVYFLLLKILACFAFSAMCFFLSSATSGSVISIAATVLITAAEGVLYFFIEPTSIFAPFRQINIIASADSGKLLGRYLNINVFGTPFFALPVSIIVAVLLASVFSVLGIVFFSRRRQAAKNKRKMSLPFGKHTRLLSHELHKTFVGGKMLILVIALSLFAILTYNPIKMGYKDIADFIYVKYVDQLQGEVSDEKLEFVEGELYGAYNSFDENSAERIVALEKLKSHMLYLQEKDGLLFNEKGYDMLTGEDDAKQNDRFSACAMSVLITIIAGYIYCEEYRTRVFQLLRTTANGRGKTFLCKLITAVIASFFLLLIFNGINFYNVLSAYGTEFIFASAHSIERLEAIGEMPIFWYLVLLVLGRLIALTLQSVIIFFMSAKLKSYSLTVIGGILFFGVPPIIAAAGFTYMDYFLIEPILVGNIF